MRYKIGMIAKIMGVSPEMVRHYERMGLITPEKDAESKYRYYSDEQLSQLLYVQRFSKMGMSLADIREYLLQGNLQAHYSMIEKCLQDCRKEVERLELKQVNMENYLRVLRIAQRCRNHCIFYERPATYFLSNDVCIECIQQDRFMDQIHLYQDNSDLFFPSTQYEWNGDNWEAERGVAIFEDCARYISIHSNACYTYHERSSCVFYAYVDDEENALRMHEDLRAFFTQEHIEPADCIASRLIFRNFENDDERKSDTKVVRMLAIPYRKK